MAEALIERVHREAVGNNVVDPATAELLKEVLAYPGVPARWQSPSLDKPLLPLVPVTFKKGPHTFNFFSTVTTLGTPRDMLLSTRRGNRRARPNVGPRGG